MYIRSLPRPCPERVRVRRQRVARCLTREATVSGKAIYKVIEVLVQEGQAVKEGEILARLDDTNTRAALEQSRAQVTQLDAALSAARIAADDARPVYLR